MQRLAESAQMSEWLSKEEDFQLDQERTRAAIRIKEKRAKAVDFLALNLRYVNPITEEGDELTKEGLEIDLDEPYNIVDVCSLCVSSMRTEERADFSPAEPYSTASRGTARRH